MLAERIVGQLRWSVEALTSCAFDANTWGNHYKPGPVDLNGVTVRRFSTKGERHADFLRTSTRVHGNPLLASTKDQNMWIDQQGPLVPELVETLADADADVVIFYPYLYYPTVRGLPKVGRRSVMHPAAHDEPSIRMSVFAPVFAQAQGFVFQTDGERRMVERMFAIAERPQLLLGLGVEPQSGDEAAFRSEHGLGDRPYLVCLGRVDDGKGCRLLATYFARYKRRYPSPLALAFVGPVVQPLEKHDDIFVTGPVSEAQKWGALRGAELLVSPSPFEAFSLALVEGWAAGRPALVNAACPATREHAERSAGGLWFHNYLSFEVALHRIATDHVVASGLGRQGESYVNDHFRWPVLIEHYARFLEYIGERAQKRGSRPKQATTS